MTPWPSGLTPVAVKSEKTPMIRAIALATVLGALVASVAMYAISPPGWRNRITPLFGGLDRGAERATMPEDWSRSEERRVGKECMCWGRRACGNEKVNVVD